MQLTGFDVFYYTSLGGKSRSSQEVYVTFSELILLCKYFYVRGFEI